MHVVLVGMMGSGKSTVGRRVAGHLGRPFVDADEALEVYLGRTVAEVFAEEGEARFRDEEAAHLRLLLDAGEPSVLAAGGGVVLREENRARLRQEDITTVWLRADPAFLASRAKAKPHRPLLGGQESPRELFERLDRERRHLYAEVADVTVDVQPFHTDAAKPKAAMAERIVDLVREHEAASAVGGPGR